MNVLKHLVVFVIGLAVVWAGGRLLRSEPDGPTAENNAPPGARPTNSSRPPSASGKPPVSASDYQEAWQELTRMDPWTEGHAQARERLIADWLRDDCTGALSVLMMHHDTAVLAKKLIKAEMIDANEDWIIASLRDHSFGINGRFLLDVLVSKRADASPESMWKLVDLVDPKNQRIIFGGAFKNPDTRDEWLRKVEELSTPSVRKRARYSYISHRSHTLSGKKEPIADVISFVREMENPETRAHMAAAIIDQNWNYHPEKPIALLDSMEGDMYDAALDAAVAHLPSHQPTTDLLKHLNAYLDGDHFEAFNRIDDEFLRGWTFDDDAMRDWAWQLPERSESARMVRGTVARKFSRDPEAAREWLAEKTPGWHRDQAMVELARVAKEPNHASWVLGEITDPDLRTEAEGHLRGR